jgi:hypothetical protein
MIWAGREEGRRIDTEKVRSKSSNNEKAINAKEKQREGI